MIRFFDILFSAIGLLVLSPLFLILWLMIKLSSKGPGFFVQERIGLGGKPFGLYKFRSMRTNSESESLITIGEDDHRITRIGHFIRKYKLDELPQLWNVLRGDMSLVGPRPEVRKYVEMYTPEQRKVLDVKPGITDYASIEYVNENELLGNAEDPDRVYVEQVMPNKLKLNMKYIQNKSLGEYFKIIFLTLKSIASIGSFNKLINWYFNRKSLPFWGLCSSLFCLSTSSSTAARMPSTSSSVCRSASSSTCFSSSSASASSAHIAVSCATRRSLT